MSVSDKTAVVTGAGSKRGIGRATAHALAAAGWNIAILDLDEASAKDAATRGRRAPRRPGRRRRLRRHRRRLGRGRARRRRRPPSPRSARWSTTPASPHRPRSSRSPREEWERMFAVNVRGSYNITRQLAPGMAERGFGRIVFLSSVSAERGGGVFGGVAYSAAKAGPARIRPGAGPRTGPEGHHRQLGRPRPDRHRHHRRQARRREGEAGPRRGSGRPQGQRPRRRRPDHLPVPRGVGLHHRRHLRRQRRLAHPLRHDRAQKTACSAAGVVGSGGRRRRPAHRGTTYEIELSNLGSETRSHEPSMNRDEVLP